jgi:hypothetical protein
MANLSWCLVGCFARTANASYNVDDVCVLLYKYYTLRSANGAMSPAAHARFGTMLDPLARIQSYAGNVRIPFQRKIPPLQSLRQDQEFL